MGRNRGPKPLTIKVTGESSSFRVGDIVDLVGAVKDEKQRSMLSKGKWRLGQTGLHIHSLMFVIRSKSTQKKEAYIVTIPDDSERFRFNTSAEPLDRGRDILVCKASKCGMLANAETVDCFTNQKTELLKIFKPENNHHLILDTNFYSEIQYTAKAIGSRAVVKLMIHNAAEGSNVSEEEKAVLEDLEVKLHAFTVNNLSFTKVG